MKYRLALISPLAVLFFGFLGAQSSACNGSVAETAGDGGLDGSLDTGAVVGDELDEIQTPVPDAAVSCAVNVVNHLSEDFIDFCFLKQILQTEHTVFDPKLGIASSWSATNGSPTTDGGVTFHDVRDDVAYGASLALYAISQTAYGDNSLQATVLSPDLPALASVVVGKLGTLPASYDGELYMRLRRFAQGLRAQGGLLVQNDATVGGSEIDALADAYGRAIYANYFHFLTPAPVDAGSSSDGGEDGGAEDGGVDASTPDAAIADAGPTATPDGSVPELNIPDGILGLAQPGGGILYDVDQAASGALALVEMASRHASDDPNDSYLWASAAASVFNHLAARSRDASGLYYADSITSADPDHDALASIVTPNDALLAETQGSVSESLLRALGIVQSANPGGPLVQLSQFPFAALAVQPLSALKGVSADGGTGVSLWDPTSTTSTTAACGTLPDAAACGGSGLFVRYLPSSSAVDNSEKTLRANALVFGAVHRTLAVPGSALSIDWEPLTALFTTPQSPGAPNQSFISQVSPQTAYPSAFTASLGFLPSSQVFTAQADAYAIEALTEQWIGEKDCPPSFY